jgi:polar amino acid transport system substrate-binding protein
MKSMIALRLMLVSLILLSTHIAEVMASEDQLVLRSQSVPPVSFLDDGQPAGLAIDIIDALMAQTGTTAEVVIGDWHEAYTRALEPGQHGVFSTVMTPERKPLFQWVGPIVLIETVMFSRIDDDRVIHNLDQARSVPAIATVTDYYSDELLRQAGGFDNIQRFADERAALNALLDGRVDLMVGVNVAMAELLRAEGLSNDALRRVFSVSSDLAYLAFSPAVEAQQVEAWQQALDQLKAEGTFAEIYQQWLPNEVPPGRLHVVTEDYPPVTFMRDGQPAGFVTEMVQTIMSDLGLDEPIRLTAWSNAYRLASTHPNTVLFSIDRTAAREDQFRWVGPVASNTAVLYARADSTLTLNTLDDARDLEAIATTSAWWTETALQEAGFTNLISASHPRQNVEDVMSGAAQLSIFTDLTVAEIVAEAGYTMADLKPLLTIDSNDIYIALSADTTDEVVARWQAALDALKADGRFEAITRQYVPHADLSRLLGGRP